VKGRVVSADKTYRFVNDLWNDEEVAGKSPLQRLVYRSNKLGADQRITNTGGGNTSTKAMERDPLSGQHVEVLWVKGSGGDLRTSKEENFSSLYQEKLLALQDVYASQSERGPKTPAEDQMVGLFNHTNFNLNSRAPSIDTPLHSFVPYKNVDHTHPNAVIAVAASRRSAEITREIYGDSVVHVPWLRPGFELGLQMQQVIRDNPQAVGIVMGQHGLINWADDDKACYYQSLDLIEKAADYIENKYQERGGDAAAFGGAKYDSLSEDLRHTVLVQLLPWLRGQVSTQSRLIATVETRPQIQLFVNSSEAPRLAELGTSCPDHFLRTKIKPLYVEIDLSVLVSGDAAAIATAFQAQLEQALPAYRADYEKYYNTCRHDNSPAVRDSNPTVILLPGIGMVAFGKSKSESRVTAEFYSCAVEVMRGAEAIDEYISLPQQEAFDIEYWLLEEAKLQRMPPEKELARQVAVVIGAGSGIGKEVAHRLIREGACIVAVDRDLSAAQATADELIKKVGHGIGVAGTGVSGCGDAIALQCDITDRESVGRVLEQVVIAYGGFDHVVVTAGIFVPPDVTGHIPDDKWALTFAINVTGSYVVADTAREIWQRQGLRRCSLTLTTSANAVVAKKGSVAYDVSKAAANHLVRELAIELAPLVRVNGVAPATVVAGSAMFPRDRVISSLAKYSIAYDENESTEELRDKLARFYAERTITREPITPADQAEAFYILTSGKLSKTSGQIIAVDGGLEQAFLR
jgi:rhamnulose-1-phosphate aldolase/alcohol dehydrogenase